MTLNYCFRLKLVNDYRARDSGGGGGGGEGGNYPLPRENYIYDFQYAIINYSLDIWDFFRYIGLTAPLVKNPGYGPE